MDEVKKRKIKKLFWDTEVPLVISNLSNWGYFKLNFIETGESVQRAVDISMLRCRQLFAFNEFGL